MKNKNGTDWLGAALFCMEDHQAPPTILVVEDELLIRSCSVATLEDAGYHVVEASNGAEALAILARPNVIVLLMTDVRMPDEMDGLALVAKVKIDRPDIRSIIVSANVTAEDACDAGAVGMIAKPFMAETLVCAISSTIGRDLAA
jgi:CheY-like chemotaxis protein